MKILVLGGGGREHALVWALSRSAEAGKLVCAPGNAGIAALARCIPLDLDSVESMMELVREEAPGLVVVGPELPLAVGIVDALGVAGVKVFGPTRAAARLETSKGFAKHFMGRWGIPTAAYAVCESIAAVREALSGFGEQMVVKADGLAAGKGVVLCASQTEVLSTAEEMFSGRLGFAAESLVLEETLLGPEISFFAICDGVHAARLGLAQDHKRIGEGDTGPNTGGMGAYSTDDLLPAAVSDWVLEHVAQRVVDGMRAEGMPFVGVLFIGLMMTESGPKVLEFNTRFGDPETEALMLRLENDFVEVLMAAVDGRVADLAIRLRPGASACVVAASAGYPGAYAIGKTISGLGGGNGDAVVFHAGTRAEAGEVVTSGGRVLVVAAEGKTLPAALAKAYRRLEGISFDGMYFRRDIGWQALDCQTAARADASPALRSE